MNEELLVYKNPKSVTAEMFRSLRTNLQFMCKDLRTLLVLSSFPEEGKTWVSTNLAVAFAQMGKKVIIIDADMRKGGLNKLFRVPRTPGLSNYLSDVNDINGEIESYVTPTKIDNLFVIPNGDVPANPSELLISEKTIKMIDRLKKIADLVVIDGTPCSLVTDSIILSKVVDTNLIVTSYGKTEIGVIKNLKRNIENAHGNIAGVVINKMPMEARKYYKGYYGDEDTKSSHDNLKNIVNKMDDLKEKVNKEENESKKTETKEKYSYDINKSTLENKKQEKNVDVLKKINDFLEQ